MTLYDLDLLALQPAFLRTDPPTMAICNALQPVFELMRDRLVLLQIYTNIDGLSEDVLDQIAIGWTVSWYPATGTLAEKREVIKSALQVFMYRGTAWAVKEAVRAAFGEATVMEWFEYGAAESLFKILVSDETATSTRAVEFLRTLDRSKNLSSHLDEIVLLSASDAPLRWGCASVITYIVRSEQIG